MGRSCPWARSGLPLQTSDAVHVKLNPQLRHRYDAATKNNPNKVPSAFLSVFVGMSNVDHWHSLCYRFVFVVACSVLAG
jgi:hypothetical protein